MTKRENYLIAARGGKPEWVPCFPEDSNSYMPDFWRQVDPETGTDMFNVKWIENEYGRMPDERWRAIDHISKWRDAVKLPDLAAMDWDGISERFRGTRDPEKVNIAMLNTHGIFLIPVNMLGWVDCLTAIHTDRDELEAFVSTLTDFLVELTGYLCRYLNPDIVFTGDDLAATKGPFVSKEVWNELYKPYFAKIVDAVHAGGALCEFHNCGNCGYLIQEYIDLGVDICQLPAPNAELLRDKQRLGNRLVITGGWDRHGKAAMPGATEDEVRRSVHTAIDTYGSDGALIFWDGGIAGKSEDSQKKMEWVYDEFHKYSREVYRSGVSPQTSRAPARETLP